MCEMCDGKTLDEVLIGMDGRVARFGWSIEYVEAPEPWAYTIGLAGGFAHPELIIVGVAPEVASAVLNDVGERVRSGERLYAGERFEAAGLPVELGAVHRDHFDRLSTFNMWWNYYAAHGSPEAEPTALQVILSDDVFCDCHRQPRLAHKGSSVGHGSNRAWRRLQEQKRRRRKGERRS